MKYQIKRLPQGFVSSGLELAKGAELFGKSLEDMTREELIATAAHGWNAERALRERSYAEAKERADWYLRSVLEQEVLE